MTERDIQNILFTTLELKQHWMIVPNVKVFGWEADLISVSKSGYVTEYEIKTTMADFKNEQANKKRKMRQLADKKYIRKPNYFTYVCPEGVIRPEDLPEFAGLIYVPLRPLKKTRKRRMVRYIYELETIVKPKLMHKLDIQTRELEYLVRGLQLRYWKTRFTKAA